MLLRGLEQPGFGWCDLTRTLLSFA
jgi:hypothetical protein